MRGLGVGSETIARPAMIFQRIFEKNSRKYFRVSSREGR